ncbi:MAG: DUF192 domain-containing protein [Bacilli bacterium]
MKIKIKENTFDVKVADTWFKRRTRLMLHKPINFALLIPNCIKIHTYFMKDNIDILVINEKNSVLYKYQNLSKNKIILLEEDIKKTSILELPKNTSKKIHIGDVLTFESE